MKSTCSILIADDHEVMLDGLKAIIQMQADLTVAGTASNGNELLIKAAQLKPDIFIIDLDMPVMDGIEASIKLLAAQADAKIIILTMHGESSLIKKLKAIGVKGYLNKTCDSDELVFAIRQVLKGKTFFADTATSELPKDKETEIARTALLTKREKEVIKLLCEGFTNTKIGETLFVSPSTADNHRSNIMRKLDVHNVVELTRFCLRNNLA